MSYFLFWWFSVLTCIMFVIGIHFRWCGLWRSCYAQQQPATDWINNVMCIIWYNQILIGWWIYKSRIKLVYCVEKLNSKLDVFYTIFFFTEHNFLMLSISYLDSAVWIWQHNIIRNRYEISYVSICVSMWFFKH